MTKQTFGTAQAAREYLVTLGFPSFRKGLVRGKFEANGKVAHLDYGLLSKTGQSSMGASAVWGYVVAVE